MCCLHCVGCFGLLFVLLSFWYGVYWFAWFWVGFLVDRWLVCFVFVVYCLLDVLVMLLFMFVDGLFAFFVICLYYCCFVTLWWRCWLWWGLCGWTSLCLGLIRWLDVFMFVWCVMICVTLGFTLFICFVYFVILN